MYDTSVVQMGPCLLFAPDLAVVRRTGTRTTMRIGGWSVAVDTPAADELLALRSSLAEFIQRTVGEPPHPGHREATEALRRAFATHAPVVAYGFDEDDEAETEHEAQAAEGPELEAVEADDAEWTAEDMAEAAMEAASARADPSSSQLPDTDAREPPESWDTDE